MDYNQIKQDHVKIFRARIISLKKSILDVKEFLKTPKLCELVPPRILSLRNTLKLNEDLLALTEGTYVFPKM